MYKDSTLGNKKIAKYMGEQVDPMKIRQEKIKHYRGKRKIEKQENLKKIMNAQEQMDRANWIAEDVEKYKEKK